MKLSPTTVDPKRLYRPGSVAKRMAVHPSMVTHWMDGNSLDFVEIDGVKLIPEESIAVLEAMRLQREQNKADGL